MTSVEHFKSTDFMAANEVIRGAESFTDWLIDDPSARYRLRAALNTFDIRPPKSQGHGYISEPFIDMNRFCDYFDLSIDPESEEARRIAVSFLDGSIELARDYKAYVEGSDEEIQLDIFKRLPAFLQMLAAFKVIEGINPVVELTEEVRRSGLKNYFTDHLGVDDEMAEDILRSASIIHASEVLVYLLSPSRKHDDNSTGVSISNLSGPTNPEQGIYVGFELDKAVTEYLEHEFDQVIVEMFLEDQPPNWGGKKYQENFEQFWPRVDLIIDRAVDLLGVPEDDRNMWRSYFFGKASLDTNTKVHTRFGYNVGLDQLANWEEPLGDNEYASRIKTVNDWFVVAERHGLDLRGIDLVRHGFASKIIDKLESEVVYSHNNKRSGRIDVVASMMKDMQYTSPDLVNKVLCQSALLSTALRRAMDPWGYRFSNPDTNNQV